MARRLAIHIGHAECTDLTGHELRQSRTRFLFLDGSSARSVTAPWTRPWSHFSKSKEIEVEGLPGQSSYVGTTSTGLPLLTAHGTVLCCPPQSLEYLCIDISIIHTYTYIDILLGTQRLSPAGHSQSLNYTCSNTSMYISLHICIDVALLLLARAPSLESERKRLYPRGGHMSAGRHGLRPLLLLLLHTGMYMRCV